MKRLMFTFGLILLSSVVTGFPAYAIQEEKSVSSRIDELFRQWDTSDSPGASLAVIKDGMVVYRRGYGSANLEYGVPITPSTIFHVASVSKQFTAMAINMLAREGKLSLDDDIHTYLPEIPDFGKKITIINLINHTSGLRDQWELLAMAGWRLDDVITTEQIMKMVRHQKELNFEPGAEYLYCNTGYTLLAQIVERVSGTPFPQWCAENIFKPLGMSSTHFHDDHQMIVKNRAYSYSGDSENGFKKSVLSYANVGATSLFATVEDLANWMRNFEEKRVGGPEVIARMQTKGKLNDGEEISYAHGLVVRDYRGTNTISHSGGDAGFRSHLLYLPEQKLGVVILSNLGSFDPGAMAFKIADLYLEEFFGFEKTVEESSEREAVSIDPAIFDRYSGRYELKDWLIVTFTRENGNFYIESPGMGKTEIFPSSETEFFMKVADVRIVFEKNDEGKSNRLKIFLGSTERQGVRLPMVVPTEALLAEFAGDYYSEELGTTYTLVLMDGVLTATHRRHDDIPLEYIDTDRFMSGRWFFSKLRFGRDENNRITGFRLTGGRVRNLQFDKVIN